MTREAAADTRAHKGDTDPAVLPARWTREAEAVGWTAPDLAQQLAFAGPAAGDPVLVVTVSEVLDGLSARGSTWTRAGVVRAICDNQRPVSSIPGHQWAATVERAADQVLEACVDLDPVETGRRRRSDGRSVWIAPTAAQFSSDAVLVKEERVLIWALDAQVNGPDPSLTVAVDRLDLLQADAAAAVAGRDRLVVVVGPAGAGKTTMLARAVDDLTGMGRAVFGVAPTAKASQVSGHETGMATDTLAKLLHEWTRPDRPPLPEFRLGSGATVIVDEAGMVGTSSLARLVDLADRQAWRLVLVGDPRQLQAVGRGGMFAELCATTRAHELARLHRFTQRWEAPASLRLRAGDPAMLDVYQAHGRIMAGTFDEHLDRLAREWVAAVGRGQSVAITASTNAHVDALNHSIQHACLSTGGLDPDRTATIGDGERAHVGDVVVTRRNDRRLLTTAGQPVRNRDRWTVTGIADDGLVVSHNGGHGTATLPGEYVQEHVRLGYAATEHGHQGDTVTVAYELVSRATGHRGLYVGATRGRDANHLLVVTETRDATEARDVLEQVLANDRSDLPAVAQRRHLANQAPPATRQAMAEVPAWFDAVRRRLVERHDQAVGDLDQLVTRRHQASVDLEALEPELDAAQAAWAPYATQIAAIRHHLDQSLNPAYWAASADARHAGIGGRHATRRRASEVGRAVDDAHATIADIETVAGPARHRLDELVRRASGLREAASEHGPLAKLERFDRQQLQHDQDLLDALDTWHTWAIGQPTPDTDVAAATATIAAAARHARPWARHPDDLDHGRYHQLLQPVLAAHPELEATMHRPSIGRGL